MPKKEVDPIDEQQLSAIYDVLYAKSHAVNEDEEAMPKTAAGGTAVLFFDYSKRCIYKRAFNAQAENPFEDIEDNQTMIAALDRVVTAINDGTITITDFQPLSDRNLIEDRFRDIMLKAGNKKTDFFVPKQHQRIFGNWEEYLVLRAINSNRVVKVLKIDKGREGLSCVQQELVPKALARPEKPEALNKDNLEKILLQKKVIIKILLQMTEAVRDVHESGFILYDFLYRRQFDRFRCESNITHPDQDPNIRIVDFNITNEYSKDGAKIDVMALGNFLFNISKGGYPFSDDPFRQHTVDEVTTSVKKRKDVAPELDQLLIDLISGQQLDLNKVINDLKLIDAVYDFMLKIQAKDNKNNLIAQFFDKLPQTALSHKVEEFKELFKYLLPSEEMGADQQSEEGRLVSDSNSLRSSVDTTAETGKEALALQTMFASTMELLIGSGSKIEIGETEKAKLQKEIYSSSSESDIRRIITEFMSIEDPWQVSSRFRKIVQIINFIPIEHKIKMEPEFSINDEVSTFTEIRQNSGEDKDKMARAIADLFLSKLKLIVLALNPQ